MLLVLLKIMLQSMRINEVTPNMVIELGLLLSVIFICTSKGSLYPETAKKSEQDYKSCEAVKAEQWRIANLAKRLGCLN